MLVKTIATAVDQGTDEVEMAKITGRYDDDDEIYDTIDLIHDRGTFTQKIDRARLRDPARLMSAVRQIWSRNRDTI